MILPNDGHRPCMGRCAASDFGLYSGVVNSASRLSSAINSPQDVEFDGGVYDIDGPITIGSISDKCIFGQGKTRTTIRFSCKNPISFGVNVTVDNVSFQGIKFESTVTTNLGSDLGIIGKPANCNINKFTINSCAFNGGFSNAIKLVLLEGDVVREFKVKDTSFVNIGRMGVETWNFDGINYIMDGTTIEGCEFISIGKLGPGSSAIAVSLVANKSTDNKISNCYFSDIVAVNGATGTAIELSYNTMVSKCRFDQKVKLYCPFQMSSQTKSTINSIVTECVESEGSTYLTGGRDFLVFDIYGLTISNSVFRSTMSFRGAKANINGCQLLSGIRCESTPSDLHISSTKIGSGSQSYAVNATVPGNKLFFSSVDMLATVDVNPDNAQRIYSACSLNGSPIIT